MQNYAFSKEKLLTKIAILIDGLLIPKCILSVIDKLSDDGFIITFVSISDRETQNKYNNKNIIWRAVYKIIRRVETYLLQRRSVDDLSQKVLLPNKNDFEVIYIENLGKFPKLVASHEAIMQLELCQFDAAIRANSHILTGGILSIARTGIFSVHHGEISKYRGQPPGLWEVINKEPATHYVVQVVNEVLDGGLIID